MSMFINTLILAGWVNNGVRLVMLLKTLTVAMSRGGTSAA